MSGDNFVDSFLSFHLFCRSQRWDSGWHMINYIVWKQSLEPRVDRSGRYNSVLCLGVVESLLTVPMKRDIVRDTVLRNSHAGSSMPQGRELTLRLNCKAGTQHGMVAQSCKILLSLSLPETP